MASSLPPRPSSSSSSSLRKDVLRLKRSPSPSSDSPSASLKKGRYQRPESAGSDSKREKGSYSRPEAGDASAVLLSRALGGAHKPSSSSQSTPNSKSSSNSNNVTPSSSSRAQFEQQEDFISFGFEEAPRSHSSSRAASVLGSASSGRVLDEFEEKKVEGSRRVQKRERERSTPWCVEPGVDWQKCDSAIAMLNAEAHAFITYISPTPIEHELRLWTVELIRRVIKSRWPDADVECFGSVGTGLYLPGGDIDLVVLCPSFPSPPSKPTSSLLHSLASLLLTSSLAEPSSLLVIAKSRVPIVKFTTRHGGFAVDLSVNQKGGVDAAIRVRGLLESYAFREAGWKEDQDEKAGRREKEAKRGRELEEEEREEEVEVDHGVARSLVLLVKAFLNQRGMNEVFTGGLGSYSIICLVVSFLQLHPKIQTGEILPSRNIGLLFTELLEYYGKHFNFDEAGITLRGRGGYFNKHDKGWFRPQQPYLLSIEDPSDPQNDVSGGSHNIMRVRQTLAGAFDVLSATLIQRVSHFAALHDPSSIPLSSSVLPNSDFQARDPLSQSILGAILGMSKAGVKGREDNVRLYEDGVLQGLLSSSVDPSKGPSLKRMKKLAKKEKEDRRVERTIARLEMRSEETRVKLEKKDKKRKALEGTLAPMAGRANEEDKSGVVRVSASASARGGGTERPLFVIDTEPDEEGSRYSIIGSPAPPPPRAKNDVEDIIFIGSDSEDEDEEGSSGDDDVVLGGSGGDQLKGKARAAVEDAFGSDTSGEVERGLLGAKRSEEEKKAKKTKAEAKNAFWAKKGPKEGIEVLVIDD